MVMMAKRFSKIKVVSAIFGCLFGMMNIFGGPNVASVYAEPQGGSAQSSEVQSTEDASAQDTGVEQTLRAAEAARGESVESEGSCQDSLGALGWIVCPATGKFSEAVDWLYDKIEEVLVINPVKMEDGAPIYEIWKYMRGITNVLFIVFLLVMVYSQITGLGITNYGLKKTLPKLIVGAVLVNLSFIVCSLAVDASNIIGTSLRGLFESIEASTLATTEVSGAAHLSLEEMYSALAGGTGVAIGSGVVAFETGAIWMLIPTALGALVSVVVGLITIALRQAVVAILIMIAPLAIMAYILPNTDKWFKQWKDLLFRMLVFYPMFSLLFGAASLAGWAIIVSAQSGFFVLVGLAVQIFPLIFSWSLMKMSGTFLANVNSKLSQIAASPLATNRAWADSRRQLTQQKGLAARNVYTPSLRLAQFLNDRKVMREEETKEFAETVKARGQAYAVNRNYDKNGLPTREGETAYEAQARRARYQRAILRHQNNLNKGLGDLAVVKARATAAQKRRIADLDDETVESFDNLKIEQARTEKIDYDNATSFHKRMEDAINAHMDDKYWNKSELDKRTGKNKLVYKRHFASQTEDDYINALKRYNTAAEIMEGNVQDTQYAAAFAAHAYDTQAKIYQTKMQKYFELTPPTRDVEYRLGELTKHEDALKNIDAIVAGMRVLNQRGDTDLVREQLQNVLDHGVELGTHASQALAGFLMFDVSDSDPFLKRFGKYINLETANVYNQNKRKEMKVTMDEYVTGSHIEPDGEIMYAKRPMRVLLEGTSLDKIERTAMKDLDDILKYTYSKGGTLDVEKYLTKRNEIETAIGPQFISASLKYLSGSEQLKSAVSFLTGYNLEQRKDEAGKVLVDDNGDPIYDIVPRWGKDGDLAANPEYARKYFRKKTEQYFKDQTPTQLFGFRTDYREPVIEHLLSSLFEEHPEIEEEYQKEIAEIQTRYGDEPDAKKAEEKRKNDVTKLKRKLTGDRLRTILDQSGKLEQIYRTRRSGAANNAKDWFRDWLLLNDEDEILRYLDQKQQERYYEKTGKKPPEVVETAEGDSGSGLLSLYKQSDRVALNKELGKIYDMEMDDDTFYQLTHDKLEEKLGKNRLITKRYEEFKAEVLHADKNAYMTKLEELIGNPDNYDA